MNLEQLGKTLIMFAIFMLLAGMFLYFLGRTFNLPRLPGDIYYKKGVFTFYFPVVTSILISIVLTILFNLFFLFFRR